MGKLTVDSKKLGEALEKFGSLQNALEGLLVENRRLEGQVAELKKQNYELMATRGKLKYEIGELNECITNRKAELQAIAENIQRHGAQYGLFCQFMAMLLGSASVTDSLDMLVALFQRLKDQGCRVARTADELRSVFLRNVMGDYLKSFRCVGCGAKFITNKPPPQEFMKSGYCCPVCHYQYGLEADDSFLRAIVSDKQQLEDVKHTEEILKENEILKPFKDFLNVPCEICHKPIQVWDGYNIKLVIEGTGFGHTLCWKSDLGRMREVAKVMRQMREKQN